MDHLVRAIERFFAVVFLTAAIALFMTWLWSSPV